MSESLARKMNRASFKSDPSPKLDQALLFWTTNGNLISKKNVFVCRFQGIFESTVGIFKFSKTRLLIEMAEPERLICIGCLDENDDWQPCEEKMFHMQMIVKVNDKHYQKVEMLFDS